MYNKPQGTLPEADSRLVALRTSAVGQFLIWGTSFRAFPEAGSIYDPKKIGGSLRTLALKSSNLREESLRHSLFICDRQASGTFLRLLGAYTCKGWALGTSKSSSYCAAAAAAHTPLCNRVASYMELWVLH
ncbi:hypothetical protein BY996DRAFT_6416153 [Phakopsora pachyrhizi]|nr:hypothetical protein BY996DRAFT_6416153 [Phakopsora pachyrhizi]